MHKVRDPEDGRAWFAVLTPKGRERQRRVARIYLQLIAEHLASKLTKADLLAMRKLLERATMST